MASYIFPKSDLGGAKWNVDEHFSDEYRAAESSAPVALVDLYSLQDRPQMRLPENFSSPVIYRGWMLTEAEYKALEKTLKVRGFSLVTDSEQYLRAHEISGWIEALSDHTPTTVVLPMNITKDALLESTKTLPKDDGLFIKGVSKSNSGLTKVEPDEDLSEALKRFRDLEYLSDNDQVVIRSFVPLNKQLSELRAWFVNGSFVKIMVHPNFTDESLHNPLDSPDLLSALEDKLKAVSECVQGLELDFCTVDFAFTESGSVLVIELGDGQVSGVTGALADLEDFYHLLTESFGS